ncbi:CocE/NonD family hydrolase [Emergencia sp. 1XD21-10]|uniref:CocE/NonD family hydrolase n=1 Tax=Emergencia sp. 1XD21-10 TaxID=2304569 RepID=UPI001A9B05CE|nr:CocE/NonD family hydrolase [Emergencia sp. 1XD21-10]NCE98681.1 CocE/NonD family hydrolase [Emergencia sp. 1XD21-10]
MMTVTQTNTINEEVFFERVYVETPVDTDKDGKYDLIAVYIKRPVSTLYGEKVPVVYEADPYLLDCNKDWYVPYPVNQDVRVYPTQNISEEEIRFDFSKEPVYSAVQPRKTCGFAQTSPCDPQEEPEDLNRIYNHFNQRGYATIFCGGLGTKGSEGLLLTGSREEILAFRAVIDWLCGRCRAFTNRTDNIEIKADWCTGKIAMIAKSYLGTMAIGVAATGVEGLETIIPEAGICNWYNYYRTNGLVTCGIGCQGEDIDSLAKFCFSRAKDSDYEQVKDLYAAEMEHMVECEDRNSGNYNLFWDERNYLNQISNFKASAFIIHGINDWNVKTDQCVQLFQALERNGIERKLLLHQGEHSHVYALKDAGVTPMLDRWLDHYLKGVDNGVEKEPKVLVESNTDQSFWFTSDTWPPASWSYQDFPIKAAAPQDITVITDDLSATVYDKEANNQKEWLDHLILDEDEKAAYRCRFFWNPWKADASSEVADFDAPELRISGTVKVSFDAAIDQKTAILSAMLVDIGQDCRFTTEQIPVSEIPVKENGCFVFGRESDPSAYKVISRGFLNAQNRTCLYSKEEIIPGQTMHYSFDMIPTDHSLKKGHQLALILYGIDTQHTQRPDTVTRIEIPTNSIRAQIPLLSFPNSAN